MFQNSFAHNLLYVKKKTSIEKAATDTIRINFTRTLKVCEVLFPLLRSNARVVNMSSRYGFLYFMKNKELKRKFADKIEQLMNDYLR
jgi:short-subunit dehydrogenase involved in D-alanine esterification of teichoic acids